MIKEKCQGSTSMCVMISIDFVVLRSKVYLDTKISRRSRSFFLILRLQVNGQGSYYFHIPVRYCLHKILRTLLLTDIKLTGTGIEAR